MFQQTISKAIYSLYRALFSRPIFFKLNKFLYQLSLRGMGVLNFESCSISGEKHFIKKHISQLKDGVVLDVGANIGNYSLKLRESNKHIKIYSFEPHPKTYKQLLINTNNFDINTFNLAVGSEVGELSLFDYANNDGSSHASLYANVIKDLHAAEITKHEVAVTNLDKFLEKHHIETISLLKIDTEGHELEVLKGLRFSLSKGNVKLIHFEFNEMNAISKVYFKDFWDYLTNYELYRMLPNGLVKIEQYTPIYCEIFAYQNIIAKLKEK